MTDQEMPPPEHPIDQPFLPLNERQASADNQHSPRANEGEQK